MSESNYTIDINSDEVDNQYSSMYGASQYFVPQTLSAYDGKTTIPANINSRTAHEYAQELISEFGGCLAADATNISGLHIEFCEYDAMIAELIQSGFRTETIVSTGG